MEEMVLDHQPLQALDAENAGRCRIFLQSAPLFRVWAGVLVFQQLSERLFIIVEGNVVFAYSVPECVTADAKHLGRLHLIIGAFFKGP